MIFLLPIFWYLRTTRALLFALYLWQLKSYHIGRFLDHFHTTKGRRLLYHPFIAAKLGLLVLWFLVPEVATVLLVALYIGETILMFNAQRRKTLLVPTLTRKTLILIGSTLFLQTVFVVGIFVYFLNSLFLSLLLFDLFSLVIGSLVVLAWQPYTVFERSRILKRAREKRSRLNKLKVIGITGSYGKTSTKEFLFHILQKKFVVLKTPEHNNSEMGIAHTILYALTSEHEVFVCEMGAYSRGGIRLLAKIAQPGYGIVTGVNEQHLGVFGSQMSLFSAEGGGELVEALPQDGALILNGDSKQLYQLSPWLQLWNPSFTNYMWCSTTEKKDVFAKDIVVERERIQFTMATDNGEEVKITLALVGAHNVENILLASAMAKKLGMTLKEIAKALDDFPLETVSTQMREGKKGIEVLDSSYSANPSGVLSALEHLRLWEGKKIVVMPSLIELGSASHEVHLQIGRKIGEICDMAVITTADEFPALLNGAREKKMEEQNIVFLENPKEIAEKILSKAQKGDVVLLEGRVPAEVLSLLKA